MKGLLFQFCFVAVLSQAYTRSATGEIGPHSRKLQAASIAAGPACKLNDVCASASGAGSLCPVNVASKAGTCPLVPAGEHCLPTDLCATSATMSGPCPKTSAAGMGSQECEEFAAGATCSVFTGSCGDDQICNARISEETLFSAGSADNTVGTCVTPKAAGSSCTTGVDLCSGASSYSGVFCTSGSCPLARPGAGCTGSDRCSTGGSGTASVACPPETDGSYFPTCPPVQQDGSCSAGDVCTGAQACNVATGKCVNPVRAGLDCTATESADNADICAANNLDSPNRIYNLLYTTYSFAQSMRSLYSDPFSGLQAMSVACPSSKRCPFINSGSTCNHALVDTCAQFVAGATPEAQPVRQLQFCNAVGSEPGLCTNATAAGATCQPGGVCSPSGILCPSSRRCPLAIAGNSYGYCNAGDRCFDGSAAGIPCSTDGSPCPGVVTGMTCRSVDQCVFGAQCVGAKMDGSASGACQPIGAGITASSNAPTRSIAARVPAISAVARLDKYATVADFTGAQAQFINTLEANIFAKINAIANVTVDKVTVGSVVVAHTVAFTDANSASASAAQSSLEVVLNSGDVSSIFGDSFGTVTVTNVTRTTSSNPNVPSGAGSVSAAMGVLVLAAMAVLGV